MLPPHWLDAVIDSKLGTGDAKQIAQALAQSKELLGAIADGLKAKPQSGVVGPSYVQVIRRKIQEAVG